MNSRVMLMTGVLFIGVVLFALTVVLLIGHKEENQLYDDLDTIVSARYGQEYKIVVFPPMEGRFQIVNEIVFYPHENIEGTLRVKDSNFTYGLGFSYGVDPNNLTIVCAVKREPPAGGLCRIVLKKSVSASD